MGETRENSVSMRLLRPFERVLRQRGLDVAELFERHGLIRDRLTLDSRIPHGVAAELLSDALRSSNDPWLALHAAERIRPGDFDALEHALRAATTLRDVIELGIRYLGLVHDAAHAELAVVSGTATFTLSIEGASTRPEYEYAVLLALGLARSATGLRLRPIEVELPGFPPEDDTEHRRLLTDRLVWCARRATMTFPAAALDLPLGAPDASLRDALLAYADRSLARVTEMGTFTRRVREHLEKELPSGASGATTLDLVASALGINARTLRRRLADEGTTFFEQLDGVRRALAIAYVERSDRPLTEVAALLGFGSTSALHKAFRRWTGQGPMTFRSSNRVR